VPSRHPVQTPGQALQSMGAEPGVLSVGNSLLAIKGRVDLLPLAGPGGTGSSVESAGGLGRTQADLQVDARRPSLADSPTRGIDRLQHNGAQSAPGAAMKLRGWDSNPQPFGRPWRFRPVSAVPRIVSTQRRGPDIVANRFRPFPDRLLLLVAPGITLDKGLQPKGAWSRFRQCAGHFECQSVI
jgi:hypothetical protein